MAPSVLLKNDIATKNDFSRFARKILVFPKKLFNKNIFRTLFSIKKVMSLDAPIFFKIGNRTKKWFLLCSQNFFFFSKNSLMKDYSAFNCNNKCYDYRCVRCLLLLL